MKKKVRFIFLSLLAVGSLLVFLYWYGQDQAQQDFVRTYLHEEQERLGVDCKRLKLDLASFLNSRLRGLVERGKTGKAWEELVNEQVVRETTEYKEKSFQCWRLEAIASPETGTRSSDFEKLHTSLMLIETLLKYGKTETKDKAHSQFVKIEMEYEKLSKILAKGT